MVVKLDGKELRVKEAKKGRASWIPESDDEKKLQFQELSLCSGEVRDWVNDGENGRLVALQE